MVKLSQQLIQTGDAERITRTERVKEKQRILREKKSFEKLKQEAKSLQQTEFSDVKSTEEYKQKYSTISSELQPFFQTPVEVEQAEIDQINTTKNKVEERKIYINEQNEKNKEKLRREKENYEKDMNWARERRSHKGGEWYKKYKKGKKEDLRDAENEYEEREQYLSGYTQGLNEGYQQLQAGKNLSYSSIQNYANDLGNYEEEKKRARNEQREVAYKQQRKIEDLEAQGYKPFVVEQSYKGQPEKVHLYYYHAGKGDYQEIQTYEAGKGIDVTKLEKLGYSDPQERKLLVAGKEITYKSRVPIYKTKKGEIVTPYEKTGLTEQGLIQQQKEFAVEEWEKERATKPFYDPIKEEKEIIKVDDRKWYEKSMQELFIQPTKEKVITGGKWITGKGFELIKGSPFYFKTPSVSLLGLQTGGFTLAEKDLFTGKEHIKVEDVTTEIKENLKVWRSDVQTGMLKKYDIDKVVSKEIQQEHQLRFEDLYYKKIIEDTISFEEAEKEFKESATAKYLEEKYQTRIEEETREIAWGGKATYGLKLVGISTLQLGVKLIPETTGEAGLTGITGITGYKALTSIPAHVTKISMGAFGLYGTYKAFSPISTPSEVGSGLVMMGLSGATLGYGAYKYLRSPVVKAIKIKSPRSTLKSHEVVGIDLKVITKKGLISKVVYTKQKLSQIGIAGRRTVVTTKGRELISKYAKIKIDPIYKGVPTQQLGKAYTIKSLRGEYAYKIPSAYQKAYTKLIKYGSTSSQAKAILRYYQPRVIEQYLKKGILHVKGGRAVGEFTYLTKQPVLDIDKTLGIKTRGARSIKDVYNVERKLFKDKFVMEERIKGSIYLKRGRSPIDFKEMDITRSYLFGKSTEFKRILDLKYKDIVGVSVGKKVLPSDKIIRVDVSRTKLIDKIIDLTKKEYTILPSVKKTPFAKTFADKKTADLVVKIRGKAKPIPTQQIVDKLDDVGSRSLKTASKYWGTGQYERTEMMGSLKSAVMPDHIKTFTLKDLIKVKQVGTAGLKVGQLSVIGLTTGLKVDTKLKADLKMDSKLKSLLRADVKVKTVQVPTLKSSSALKTQVKSLLGLETISPTLTTPAFTPIIQLPPIPTYTPPVIILPYLKGEIKKKVGKKKKSKYDFAYLPDFTARALGLKAETLSEKQAQKKLKKLLTGLEVRRGVIIK